MQMEVGALLLKRLNKGKHGRVLLKHGSAAGV